MINRDANSLGNRARSSPTSPNRRSSRIAVPPATRDSAIPRIFSSSRVHGEGPADVGLAGTPLEDGHADPRLGQVTGEHQSCRSRSDDHHVAVVPPLRDCCVTALSRCVMSWPGSAWRLDVKIIPAKIALCVQLQPWRG